MRCRSVASTARDSAPGWRAYNRKWPPSKNKMVAACEQAAQRGADRSIRINDRTTWDRATWQRYLDAAVGLDTDYGPPLRGLYRDIDHLTRLVGMPLAA